MSLLIGFLTFILVMNCLFLMLLILIQLPKKEAGAGIAFGGAATDALFGAGSGNALTNLTKYAGSFFVLMSVVLSVLHMHVAREGTRRLEQEVSRQASVPSATTPALPTTTANPSTPIVPVTPSAQPLAPVATTNPEATSTGTPAGTAVNPEAPAPAPAPQPK